MEKSSQKIFEKTKANKSKVSNAMNYLRQMIDEHEKQMLQDIENFHREELQQIDKYRMDLNNQWDYFQFHKQTFRFFIQMNDRVRLLRNQVKFSDYISQTKNILQEIETPKGIDYQINGLEHLQSIKPFLLRCATVEDIRQEIIPLPIEQSINWEKFIDKYQTEEEIDLSKQFKNDQSLQYALQMLTKANVRRIFID